MRNSPGYGIAGKCKVLGVKMNDLTKKPIRSIEDAERYFKSMGCSGFHLARENFNRADEYNMLNIRWEVESKWRREGDHFHKQA